jgi:hypothetical protein
MRDTVLVLPVTRAIPYTPIPTDYFRISWALSSRMTALAVRRASGLSALKDVTKPVLDTTNETPATVERARRRYVAGWSASAAAVWISRPIRGGSWFVQV